MERIWKSKISCALLNERVRGTLISHLGIEFVKVGDSFLVASMPVNEATRQTMGLLHGGASCVLAETVGSTAGNFCVDLTKEHCVGLEININHLRGKKSGLLFGKATPFHLGRKTHVWSIELRDEEDVLIAISRHTLMVISNPPLHPGES